MFIRRWSSVVLTVASVVLFYQPVADAAALRNDRRHRGTRGSRSEQERPYFWMCPEVLCPAVNSQCETIEYIVFQYDYQVRGRMINVRCESCEYCLDGPFTGANNHNRRRRSLDGPSSDSAAAAAAASSQCPHIQCPPPPAGCEDERLTDVLVNGSVCKRCPACYDNTVLNDV
jgi:hypothetical protein